MEYIKLHGTDLEIPRLSLGTWSFSGAKIWGANEEQDSIDTIHAAMDAGITLLDTAEKYGDGKSDSKVTQLPCQRAYDIVHRTPALDIARCRPSGRDR